VLDALRMPQRPIVDVHLTNIGTDRLQYGRDAESGRLDVGCVGSQ
jgi:hypothetical protein